MSRSILVDDSDTSISYAGLWFSDMGDFDNVGASGPPFQSTLHGTNSAASLSYTFNGSSVALIGTNEFSTDVSQFVSWQCSVDNQNIKLVPTSPPAANRVTFCSTAGLEAGSHTLTLNVTVQDQQTFYFDYIQYVPVSSASLEATTLVNFTDPQLIYSGDWNRTSAGTSTIQNGASVLFTFSGYSLTWFGFYAEGGPFAFDNGTYSIDNQTPTPFAMNGGLYSTK